MSKKKAQQKEEQEQETGNGMIEYADFRTFMMKMKKLTLEERRQDMIRAFRIIDRNNDKFIDVHELMNVLTSLGEPLDKKEAEAMIRVADANKDGKIDYEEFVKFITAPCI